MTITPPRTSNRVAPDRDGERDAHEIRIGASGAIVVAGSVRMTNRGSVADKTPVWFVYTFRDGLIASLATHLDPAMAEEAAGSSRARRPRRAKDDSL